MHSMDKTKWWQSGIIYQIYPRSFMDANDDGIGDLRGIISKLDYLNDGTEASLGVDAIWLSPIYPSPNKDFGYDISDYTNIDPTFGDLDDFKLLLKEAHRRGIKVLLDLVLNHTSNEHPWFIEASRSRDNPYHDWYIWHEGIGGKTPNNWFAGFDKKAWWWMDEVRKFYLSTFTRYQPEVNWRNASLKKAMLDVVRFWFDMGVDGYRMDVVNWFIKDDRFRSNPYCLRLNPPDYQRHIYDRNRPETHDICRDIRKVCDTYDDRMLVGEIYTHLPEQAAEYYGQGDELHLAFNFAFLYQKWGAAGFRKAIEDWETLLKDKGWPNYTLSNHDQPRHYSRYGKAGHSDQRARVAAALLLTLRGTPFLYYGEEIGMSTLKISRKEIVDPLGKKFWPFFKGRDPSRTPMQWGNAPHAGFTKTKPWLPVNTNYPEVNVEVQTNDPGSLLSFYRRLIWLRKREPALLIGDYHPLVRKPKEYLAYSRRHQHDTILIVLNFTAKDVAVDLGNELTTSGMWEVLLSTEKEGKRRLDLSTFTLSGYEVLIAKRI